MKEKEEAKPADEERIQKLTEELEEKEKAAQDYLAGWKRERADFLNFKRDECERIQKAIEISEREIVKKFLPVLDSIFLLEKHNSKIEGFENIRKQIMVFLESLGVKEIDCLNKEFDPNLHEAVEMIEGDYDKPTVVEELQKGYIMNDKIIRPSKVKVSIKK